MPATVYASTGGRKYHFDQACKAFENAQQLNDWDAPEDAYLANWAYPKQHALVRMSNTKAATDGKLPCLACVPAHLRELPEAEDFAHEPTKGISLFGLSEVVCQRCTERGVWYGNADHMRDVHILWPCTSAIVLGLVPRPCSHCKGNGGDPDDPGDWIPEAGMHNPNTAGPCPACHGHGHQAVGER